MASDVEIVNNALSKLGEQPILTFDDDSEPARLATRTFSDTRDDLLRTNPWNFATRRAQIAAETATPVYEFARSYPVPSDFLKLIEIDNPNRWPFKLEEGRILTDLATPINIRYIFRVTDADSMDSSFREALAAILARDWAEPLAATTTLSQQMAVIARQKLSNALALDAQEDPPKTLRSTSFLDARW
jgi:hypothetical protein